MKRATPNEIAPRKLTKGERLSSAGPSFVGPVLAKGEAYAGILLKDDGTPGHHLVLLAAKSKPLSWTDALAWAKKQGGELPTRREQSLLFANAKQHFEPRWHWSSEQHESYAEYAWVQYFGDGFQLYTVKGNKCLARAVRRVPI